MPIQGYIWLVPGFGGSELYADNGQGSRQKVWLDIPSLLRGDAPNRLILGNPVPGETIVPGSPLELLGYGYAGLRQALSLSFNRGYQYNPWGYDFRLGVQDLGPLLGQAIINAGVNADHKIIAHSYGCLIAQYAMGWLASRGYGNLVSNVLAIGGPMSGSYATVQTWRVEVASLNYMALAGVIANANPFNPQGVAQAFAGIINPNVFFFAYLNAFTSWWATYDLLPNPDMLDDPGDTLRANVWDPTQWGNAVVPPDAGKLAASKAGWQVTARLPAYHPDPNKWIFVVSSDLNRQTPFRMAPAVSPGSPIFPTSSPAQRALTLPALAYGNSGDNTATRASAEMDGTVGSTGVPDARVLECTGGHSDLQSHPGILANLYLLLNIPPSGETGIVRFLDVKRQWQSLGWDTYQWNA